MIYCFSKNLICHHDDYTAVINAISPATNIKLFWPKVRILLSRKKVVFMDIDTRDLKFLPLILLRSLWGARSLALTVSTEYVKNPRTFLEFFTKGERVIYLRTLRNRFCFWTIKNLTTCKIYSIHKNTLDQEYFSKYVNGFFYDLYLWDLPFFHFEPEIPKELENLPLPIDNYILFLGNLFERRSRTEYLHYLKTSRKYNFLMAGEITPEDVLTLKEYPNVFMINRYVNNDELFYLMSNCNVIYNFYTNQRPSGFFGRALQMNKYIIVRSNSFLNTFFKDYSNLICVSKLEELDGMDLPITQPAPFDDTAKKFDDAPTFKRIINAL